jgi:F-type H+-transporting ATPase subunit b
VCVVIPDITVFWVILFVLTTVVLLNALVFKPILSVIAARLKAVSDARELAESASARAREASAEYTEKLNAARGQVYGAMDEKRRAALDRRAALVGETKAVVERELVEATKRVQQDAAAARSSIDRDADALADSIVTRVLGRAS